MLLLSTHEVVATETSNKRAAGRYDREEGGCGGVGGNGGLELVLGAGRCRGACAPAGGGQGAGYPHPGSWRASVPKAWKSQGVYISVIEPKKA